MKLLACLCVGAGGSPPARAWNAEGHMVVAQIAYNHLDPAVKARCDALVAVPLSYSSTQSSNFVTAACWADDYKSQLGTGGWHYIDLPFSLDGTSTAAFVTPASNVVQAINLSVSNLLSSTATQSSQATSLRYLLHFVGDIQQPLHCSTAISASLPNGDGGGNSFYISGTWNNLHSLWDSGGGFLTDSLSRPLNSTALATLAAKVAVIEAAYPYTPNPGVIPDPMTWAQEGQGLAKTVSYVGIAKNASPSSAYLNTAQATTEQCMANGGHRLADLLNTLFITNRVSLASLRPTRTSFGFSWSSLPGRAYRIQWKGQFDDPQWTDLTNIIAASNSACFSEPFVPTNRFYRVVE